MKNRLYAQKYLVLLALLFIGLTACNKKNVNSEIVDDTFVINNNFEDLNKRMTAINEPITFSSNFKTPIPAGGCVDYTWYSIAEVEAPLFNGEPLSATDVRILGDKAYVSYHRQGDVYAGGIEVIDISDPNFPAILSYMEFDGVDINTLAVDDMDLDTERRIFLAGSSFKKGAVLRQVIANTGLLTSSITDIALSNAFTDDRISASANGIGLSNDYIYMSSGNSVGGTFQLDRQTLDILANEEYSDAKGIALNGVNNGDYQVSLVGGDNGKLKVHQVGTDRSLVNSWGLGPIVHQNVDEPYLGKATVTIRNGENIAFVALNASGMKSINIETGAVVHYSASDMLTIGNTTDLQWMTIQYIWLIAMMVCTLVVYQMKVAKLSLPNIGI